MALVPKAFGLDTASKAELKRKQKQKWGNTKQNKARKNIWWVITICSWSLFFIVQTTRTLTRILGWPLVLPQLMRKILRKVCLMLQKSLRVWQIGNGKSLKATKIGTTVNTSNEWYIVIPDYLTCMQIYSVLSKQLDHGWRIWNNGVLISLSTHGNTMWFDQIFTTYTESYARQKGVAIATETQSTVPYKHLFMDITPNKKRRFVMGNTG